MISDPHKHYDRWFKEQVAEGIREADDPETVMVPHEEVVKDMHRQREAIKANYDRWFKEQVAAGIREADDPNTVWVSNEEVNAIGANRRAEWATPKTTSLGDSSQT